jgi:hypothetical protein
MDHNQQGGQRRGHFHRGRRGSERRGQERRQPAPEQQATRGGDQVDVEQIMREIRSRIAQRHGIELSNQQVQELAARRLEAILDPRTVKPALLEQLRKSAGAPITDPLTAPAPEPSFTFEESTLFDSHRGVLRFIRKLLHPILKLFFNPNPLIQALNVQAKLNAAAAARELDRDRRQAEWNALHYELLQRMVTETARVTLELQSLALRTESLAAKVDFNERRVRSIEGAQQPSPGARSIARAPEAAAAPASAVTAGVANTPAVSTAPAVGSAAPASPGDGQRRRRRRRRGRRGPGATSEEAGAGTGAVAVVIDDVTLSDDDGADEDVEDGDFENEQTLPARAADAAPDAPSAAVDAPAVPKNESAVLASAPDEAVAASVEPPQVPAAPPEAPAVPAPDEASDPQRHDG